MFFNLRERSFDSLEDKTNFQNLEEKYFKITTCFGVNCFVKNKIYKFRELTLTLI